MTLQTRPNFFGWIWQLVNGAPRRELRHYLLVVTPQERSLLKEQEAAEVTKSLEATEHELHKGPTGTTLLTQALEPAPVVEPEPETMAVASYSESDGEECEDDNAASSSDQSIML